MLLQETFQFTNPINRPIGDAAGTQQAASGQAVQGSRTDADSLCRLNAVQAELGRLGGCRVVCRNHDTQLQQPIEN